MKRTMILSMAAAAIMASPAAFADHHKERGDMEGKKSHKAYMLKKMDADGDGMISKDEFMAAHEEKFNKMDADGDGFLTEDEMKASWKDKKEKWKDGKRKKQDDMHDMKDDM